MDKEPDVEQQGHEPIEPPGTHDIPPTPPQEPLHGFPESAPPGPGTAPQAAGPEPAATAGPAATTQGAGAWPPSAPSQSPPPPGSGWAYTPPPTPAPAAPPRRMSGCVIAILVTVGLIVVFGALASVIAGLMATGPSSTSLALGTGGSVVGVINISGVIQMDGGSGSLFGPPSRGAYAIMSQLREAAKDRAVKAVVLRVNSPGGSAAASQAICAEVRRLAAKKPVIVSMGDVAASGGYYVTVPATWIMASPATLTGSIGVITQSYNFADLAKKYGVRDETLTSGPFKDTLNPLRHMRPEERRLLQALVDEVYEQFISDVAQGRKLNKDRVRKLADGRVYTGSQAKRVGLIDELGNYQDALELAAKKGGITGEPKVKEFGKGTTLSDWFGLLASLAWKAGHDWGPPTPVAGGTGLWMLMQGIDMGLTN